MANPKTAAAKSTAPVTGVVDGANLPDFDQWDDIQIGFSPYFHPKTGSFIYAQIVGKDSRDPKFVRYQFKALTATVCRRGPANDDENEGEVGETVIVQPGECFSMSVYYSLADEFDYQLWYSATTGQHVPVQVMAMKKTKTKNDRTVWNFRMRAEPSVTPALNAKRDEWRALKSDGPSRPQLES